MIKTMSDSIFHIFSNELFLDLTVYQYGYEKCDPLHSYGPFVRNHYLFHYIISGKGMLSVTEKDDSAVYHMEAHSGFLIEPGRINLYSADQKFPWEYVWVEFDGLRAKELMEEAGLSNDHPVFHPISDTAADKLRDEMLSYMLEDENVKKYLNAQSAVPCKKGDFEITPELEEMRDYIENGIVADYQDHHYPSEMSVDAMIQTYLMDDSADATDTFMKRFDKEWIRYNRDVVAKVKAYEEGNDHE